MSFLFVLLWSLARSLIVGTLGCLIFLPLQTNVLNRPGRQRLARWIGLAAVLPLLMPDLILGYTYRLASSNLNIPGVAAEVVYGVLLLTRILAIQVLCLWLVPAHAITDSALHLWQQTRRDNRRGNRHAIWRDRIVLLRMKLSGPYRSVVVGWVLGVLWSFQEFEIAALLQIERHPISWTTWLFDARAAHEPLSNCLAYAAPAVVVQGLLVALCFVILRNGNDGPESVVRQQRTANHAGSAFSFYAVVSIVITSVFVAIVWPTLLQLVSGIQGIWIQMTATTLPRDLSQIFSSAIVALVSALASWKLARCLLRFRQRRWMLLAIVPGLVSPLVISLVVLSISLTVLPLKVYDSWMPMIVAQVIWLLPRACLLGIAVDRRIASEQIHSARLLQTSVDETVRRSSRKLIWILQQRPAWLCVTVLMMFAFWEVTISSTLHPVSMQPIVCRLYGEMHYGHSEKLAGLTAMSVIFPVMALAIAAEIWKLIRK